MLQLLEYIQLIFVQHICSDVALNRYHKTHINKNIFPAIINSIKLNVHINIIQQKQKIDFIF